MIAVLAAYGFMQHAHAMIRGRYSVTTILYSPVARLIDRVLQPCAPLRRLHVIVSSFFPPNILRLTDLFLFTLSVSLEVAMNIYGAPW